MARTLQEANEELGAKHKLLDTVFKEAGDDQDFSKVTVFGDGLDTQAKVDAFRALNVEMADLSKECKSLEYVAMGEAHRRVADEMKRPAPGGAPPQPANVESTKSIGQRLTASAEYKSFQEDHSNGFSLEMPDVSVKTLMETTGGFAPESIRTGRIVEAVTRPIQVLDLIPMGGTGSASVVYMEETLRTHSALEKGEGIAYAESAFELTERSSQVRKITDSLPVTDEQLEDVDQLESYIDQRLRFGLRQRLDNQVLNGTGVPPLLEGILNVAGIQTQAKGTDPRFDAIHKAMTLVRVTGRAIPGGIVLHPNDWEQIRLTRTADGIYILGNPASSVPMMLFGVPVALGDVITENTGLVGDFQNFCQIHERRGIVVEVGYTGTQFVEGKKTLRADFRVAFVVYRPAAFCTVTGL